MKHIAFTLTDIKSYKEAIKEASKEKYNSQLIQIFTSVLKKSQIKKILIKINKDFPNAVVIGTTTAGEISQAKMYDNSTVISLSLFKETKLTVAYSEQTNKKSGIKIAKKISSKHTKAAVILSEGLHGKDYNGFIEGIKKHSPKLLIAGGLAGDNLKFKKTFIFFQTTIMSKGTVAVSFTGKKLFADNNYNLNWTPIGKSFTITKSEGNIVHTIDNKSAVEHFEHYLGKDIFKDNNKALMSFQLLYKEGSTIVSRSPLLVKEKSIIFAGALKEGTSVQFGFSNASSIIDGANTIGHKLYKEPAEAIYIYSCIARKTLLNKKLENEFEIFNNNASSAGFFTYGEFYSTSNNNALLNCTTTILVLSETSIQKKRKKLHQMKNKMDLDNITFSILTHFVKQTALELEENLELLNQYKIAVDSTSLISKTDKKGLITYVNDNFCKISKFQESELLGRSHNIVRDKNVPKKLFKTMWATIQRGEIWKGTFSNKAKDGSIYYVDTSILPILDENHKIKEYIAIRQDVTKQIQAKNRIREKENLIQAIFDNQDSIVIYASTTKGTLYVNKKLFDYLPYNTLEEFKKEHSCICEYFIEEKGYTNPKENPNWIEDIANEKTDLTKAKIIAKDGKTYIFNIIIKQINNEYIVNLYDITTLENALQKAHSSEQAKSTFLANMSHEIRTPLNGILGFTDLLTRKKLDKDSKRYVDIIHKSGKTLLNVVNDILDFSKLENGELSLYESEANLFQEMEASVSTFASISKKKSIDYFTYIDTNIPKTLHCDIQRIKQVMNNLTSNAIKFTPENGEVSVSIKLQQIQNNTAYIYFSVKDSGIGIDEDKLKTIFDAFSQADNSISREFGGTGLGLSISSQYIEMMHSKLQVKSIKDQGSEFYFTLALPIVDATHQFQDNSYINRVKIQLLSSKDTTLCGINGIVSNYLDAWEWEYEKIYSLDEIDAKSSLLIVCAKLFEEKNCHKALDNYKNLQLIYIEGATNSFNCPHEKFHLLEQPMTGSSLFDMIITLTNRQQEEANENLHKEENIYEGNILVAEDNETNKVLISVLLQDRALNYTIVSNGEEAVKKALSNNYDLIFMDINMPLLDGISATKILREKGYTQPIVSLSANVIETDRKSFLKAGVDATLNKPIVPNELDMILNLYLQKTKESSNNTQTIERIQFDTIDADALSKQLSLKNPNIIKTLLHSFATSALDLTQLIEDEMINKDLLHNLKGTSGNLRFTNLYNLCIEMEEKIEQWSTKEYKEQSQKILAHLYNLIKQIEEL